MEDGMSALLKFAEDDLQIIALCFMATVYFLRLRWLLRFKASRERQAPIGTPETVRKGIIYSLANIANPLGMESTRQNPLFYIQFVIFHLGVASGISLSFIIPYLPQLLELPGVVWGFQFTMGLAFLVGVVRIYRRLSDPVVRKLSSPDDIFSLLLLTVWLFFAVWAAPNRFAEGEGLLLIYFFLTAFFLFYVPFSKISHYLYYPFTRYYFGKSMGHRGVYPLKRSIQPKGAKV
jgi:hypothetical protein